MESAAKADAINLEDVARRMVAREEKAYQDFARIFGPRLRGLFVQRGLTFSDAEDLAASCITDIALKVDKYQARDKGGFSAWVLAIARNVLADWRRQLFSEGGKPTSLDTISPFGAKYDEETLGLDLEEDAATPLIRQVHESVGELSPIDRELIQMRYGGAEFTFAEIASVLGMTAEAVRVRHHRLLKNLRTHVERQLEKSADNSSEPIKRSRAGK